MSLTPEQQRAQLVALQKSLSEVPMYRVLIIEDNQHDTELERRALMSYGIIVASATGMKEADYLVSRTPFSLIFMDWKLIGQSDVEALRALKQKASCPIIVLSGLTTDADAATALTMGAAAVMTKPLTDEQIRLLFSSPKIV